MINKYDNDNHMHVSRYFNYSYYRDVVDDEAVNESAELLNKAPQNIQQMIKSYREERIFNPTDREVRDEYESWLEERIINGKPNPNLVDYRILTWIFTERYSNLFKTVNDAIKYNVTHNVITHDELCRIIRNAYTINDWLKDPSNRLKEGEKNVYFGSIENETFVKALNTPPGGTFKINKLISTSLSPNAAYRFCQGPFYKIIIPRGMPFPFIGEIPNQYGELEVLLPFGCVFQMESIQEITDIIKSSFDITLVTLTLVRVDPPEKSAEFYCADTERFFIRPPNEPRRSSRIKSRKIKNVIPFTSFQRNYRDYKRSSVPKSKQNITLKSKTKKGGRHKTRYIRKSRKHRP